MSQRSTPDLHPEGARQDPLVGRVINDRYKVVEQIGEGGMGRVYKALQAPLDRVVALKVLGLSDGQDPSFAKRFYLEAAVTAKLTHPNTITLYDYGCTSDGIYFIAMEYLNGRTLQHVLQHEGPLAQDRVIHIAQQICRSLGEAHGLGIIHRDLKPTNVMLLSQHDDHDFAKVLDFGLVKFFAGKVPEGEVTNQGIFVGSPHYMSPEQARNQQPDQRSDIYSLGVVLYYMLTGNPPFMAASSMDIILKHVLLAPVPPHMARPDLNIAPQLEAIALKCLAKEREERFQSMDEVLTHLKNARSQATGIPAPTPTPPYAPPPTHLSSTPHPEMRTPSARRASMPPPPPDDAFEEEAVRRPVPPPPPRAERANAPTPRPAPARTTAGDAPSVMSKEWIAAFRELHERAQAGDLDEADATRYARERTALTNALLSAQRLSLKPGLQRRQTLRLVKELPVELDAKPSPAYTNTLDITTGGFAVLLEQPLRVGDRLDFTIGLRIGPVSGRARVVNLQRKGRPYRVGFTFEDISSTDVGRIDTEVFDGVLSLVDRQQRMEG